MLLTVLVLSAVFLTATVIAGLLMVYQLSQVTAVADSAKAIFAADAAIERGLFKVFRCNDKMYPGAGGGGDPLKDFCGKIGKDRPLGDLPKFLNGASYVLTILPNETVKSDSVTSIRATGNSGKSARAFEIRF